jgi:hypothetical protein
MTTSMADDAKGSEDWSEAGYWGPSRFWSAELVWTLLGLVVLVAFLFLVVEGTPWRGLLAVP